jgi:hypothetical protein
MSSRGKGSYGPRRSISTSFAVRRGINMCCVAHHAKPSYGPRLSISTLFAVRRSINM